MKRRLLNLLAAVSLVLCVTTMALCVLSYCRYERIEWGTDPHKKLAARLVQALYSESDSPLRYHINMLGGRSQRDMWIPVWDLSARLRLSRALKASPIFPVSSRITRPTSFARSLRSWKN